MGLLEACLISVGLWLLFPKGFKYLVGTWLGVLIGGFMWSLFALGLCLAGVEPGWAFVGWSFLGFIVAGIVGGCVLAANG